MQVVNQAVAGQALPSGLHGHQYSAGAWQTAPPHDADTLPVFLPVSRNHHAEHSSVESKPLNGSHGPLPRDEYRWKGGRRGRQKKESLQFCHAGKGWGLWIAADDRARAGKLTSVPWATASCNAAELSGCSMLCVLAMALNGDAGGTWSFFSLLPSGRSRSPPA